VPGDSFAVSGHFAKEVRAPCDHVLAQQVFDAGYDAWMRQDVVNAPVLEVRRADRIAIAARSQRFRQQFIKVMPYAGNLLLIENPNAR